VGFPARFDKIDQFSTHWTGCSVLRSNTPLRPLFLIGLIRITCVRQELIPTANRRNIVRTLTIQCSNCGIENRDEANYCLKCRTPLIERAVWPASAGSWMLVSACRNHPLKPSQLTCADCGAPICFECSRSSYCFACYRRRVLASEPRVPIGFSAGTFYRLF